MKFFLKIFWTNVKSIFNGQHKIAKRFHNDSAETWRVSNYEL